MNSSLPGWQSASAISSAPNQNLEVKCTRCGSQARKLSGIWAGGLSAAHFRGYTGRSTGGQGSLANIWDVSVDCPLGYGFSVTAYYGHAWGKDAIASIYPDGTNAQFGYAETNFRF